MTDATGAPAARLVDAVHRRLRRQATLATAVRTAWMAACVALATALVRLASPAVGSASATATVGIALAVAVLVWPPRRWSRAEAACVADGWFGGHALLTTADDLRRRGMLDPAGLGPLVLRRADAAATVWQPRLGHVAPPLRAARLYAPLALASAALFLHTLAPAPPAPQARGGTGTDRPPAGTRAPTGTTPEPLATGSTPRRSGAVDPASTSRSVRDEAQAAAGGPVADARAANPGRGAPESAGAGPGKRAGTALPAPGIAVPAAPDLPPVTFVDVARPASPGNRPIAGATADGVQPEATPPREDATVAPAARRPVLPPHVPVPPAARAWLDAARATREVTR